MYGFLRTRSGRPCYCQLPLPSRLHLESTYSEYDGSHVIVESARPDSLLMCFRRTSFFAENKARAYPYTSRAEHECGSKTLTIEQTACCHDLYWLTCQWAFPSFTQLCHCRDQDRGRDIAGMSSSFATLSTYDIGTGIQALLNVLWVAYHVHVEHACLM